MATLILLIQSGYKSGQWTYMFRYVMTGISVAGNRSVNFALANLHRKFPANLQASKNRVQISANLHLILRGKISSRTIRFGPSLYTTDRFWQLNTVSSGNAANEIYLPIFPTVFSPHG